jgi:hypothetical protein
MLPKENGLFLEIADGVHRLGLSILKGCMEVQNNKIWACFVVEVVFLSQSCFHLLGWPYSILWSHFCTATVTNQVIKLLDFKHKTVLCIVRLAVCNQNMKT